MLHHIMLVIYFCLKTKKYYFITRFFLVNSNFVILIIEEINFKKVKRSVFWSFKKIYIPVPFTYLRTKAKQQKI